MKKCVKKLIFSTALVSMAVLSTLSVSALTITESVNANDEFDTLSEGTTVIGITKFEPDVVITALRASKATYNDVTFNFGSEDYEGVEIYYLLLDSWYKIDEDNNASLVEDDELIEKLNELDIYYVNNKEKTIEVDYSIQLDENYELEFETDNNKNNDIKYENGKLMIPATVKKVEVFVKNKETNTRKKLDVFEKNSLNKVEFNNDSSTGTIAKGDSTGGSLTYNVNGNTITIDGEVEWYGADASAQNGRKAGNYASVRIDAGSVYTKEDLLENATVKIDDRELVKWEVVIDESLGEDTYFVFYPRFDSGTRTHTVVIEWEKGNTQTFTIELSEDATLQEEPSEEVE